jgi:hypothetical protein
MRYNWLLVATSLLIGLCPRANADVLCREQSGAVVVRGACRKAETRLNATALGLVGPPGPKGERGEKGPRGHQGPPGDLGNTASRELEPPSAGDAQTQAPWWQVLILFGTAGVIGWYTIETYKLRREAQTQTELQLRPFVIFEPGEGKDFCVRNIGNNTALNVQVETFALSPPHYADHSIMAAFPQSVPFLRAGESQPLRVRTATVGGEVAGDDFLFEILRPMSEVAKLEADPLPFRPTITIEFENIKGQRYFVQESLLHGDIEIMKFGPRSTPSSSKLRSAWQKLRVRKGERATASTATDQQDWVNGR